MEFDQIVFDETLEEVHRGPHSRYVFPKLAEVIIRSLIKVYNANQKTGGRLTIQKVRRNALSGHLTNTDHKPGYDQLMIVYMRKIREKAKT